MGEREGERDMDMDMAEKEGGKRGRGVGWRDAGEGRVGRILT